MSSPFAPITAVDFHMHSTASDGDHAPAEMAAAAARARLSRWSLTDHDSLAGWRQIQGAPGLVCGVEVTASAEGREIHIVGLGIDPAHAGFAALLDGIRTMRMRRIDALLARLPPEVRRDLTAAQVKPPEAEAVGRLHLARALTRSGGVASVRDAFDFHLADEHIADPELPQFPPVEQVTSAIRAAGGVAILAHPGVYRSIAVVGPLTDSMDGIEGAHPGLTAELQSDVLELASLRGLLLSVGSDTHRISAVRKPGGAMLNPELLAPLMERLRPRPSA
jgi:predicted metal-dependent phosphoesterase TrpH